jgi:hypothetical protein
MQYFGPLEPSALEADYPDCAVFVIVELLKEFLTDQQICEPRNGITVPDYKKPFYF